MLFTVLSPEEVRWRYERAENKRAIIEVLADLTACKKSEMMEFLGVRRLPVSKYAHTKKVRDQPPAEFDEKWAQELYDQGLFDPEIAAQMGVDTGVVWQWRRIRGLEAHFKRRCKETNQRRMALYRSGATDEEMAEAEGVPKNRIQEWRYTRKLKRNKKRKDCKK